MSSNVLEGATKVFTTRSSCESGGAALSAGAAGGIGCIGEGMGGGTELISILCLSMAVDQTEEL